MRDKGRFGKAGIIKIHRTFRTDIFKVISETIKENSKIKVGLIEFP
jgi:hypothetical protein